MKIEKETLKSITHLSRLEYESENEKNLIRNMNDVINWVSKLEEVNTNDILPLTHITDEVNVLRKDSLNTTLTNEEGLSNTKNKKKGYITVPKVL